MITIAYIYSVQAPWKSLLPAHTPYNLTDDNWVNGIHRQKAGLFVKKSWQNSIQFQIGKKIKFSNGEIREIISTEKSGPYLNIDLTGDILDGEKIGFPNRIKAIE